MLTIASNSVRLYDYQISPIVENKTFLQNDDTYLPQISKKRKYLNSENNNNNNNNNKKCKYTEDNIIINDDDDEFSVDSWDTLSNEDLDNIMEFSRLSPESNDLHDNNAQVEDYEEMNLFKKQSTATMKTLQIINTKSPLIEEEEEEDTEETRLQKREKNRLAARRCRQKQKDRIDYLEKDVKEIETANYQVENEIRQLQRQLRELRDLLVNHDCVMNAPRLTHYRTKYTQNFPPCW